MKRRAPQAPLFCYASHMSRRRGIEPGSKRYPLELDRNDVEGALRWVESYFADFGELPASDAFEVLLMLQDDHSRLERKLDALLVRLVPAPRKRRKPL